MIRFLLTNPTKFTGTAEVMYNENGTLCKIDLTQTNMPPQVVNHFKQIIPAQFTVDAFVASFGKDTTVIEAEFTVTFDMFWLAYNNKVNKKRAEAIWDKLTKTKQVLAWAAIKKYEGFLKKQGDWRNKQDPDTYLRNETFLNEY